MLFAWRSSPLAAHTPGAARAWVAASLVLSLAGCFDSKRIIFVGPDAAAVTVNELAPGEDAAGASAAAAAGEAAPGANDALSAEAPAAPAGAGIDAGSAASSDAGP